MAYPRAHLVAQYLENLFLEISYIQPNSLVVRIKLSSRLDSILPRQDDKFPVDSLIIGFVTETEGHEDSVNVGVVISGGDEMLDITRCIGICHTATRCKVLSRGGHGLVRYRPIGEDEGKSAKIVNIA